MRILCFLDKPNMCWSWCLYSLNFPIAWIRWYWFRLHKSISPYVCYVWDGFKESIWHLFLHCLMADFLWNTLLGTSGECWVCHVTFDQFLLTSFGGFGRRKEANSLWQCAIYTTVWSIWLEHNSSTFNDIFSDKHVLWDRVRHLVSIV